MGILSTNCAGLDVHKRSTCPMAGLDIRVSDLLYHHGRARTVDQNRELWYTARNRSWPPHGVSYDQLRKTRMYRLF
jgi:hypothetical protein